MFNQLILVSDQPGDRPHGVGAYDVESAVDIGLLKLLHLHLHFHNA